MPETEQGGDLIKSPEISRKRFINSAIYIEKPSITISNTSIASKYSLDDMQEIEIMRTKRCTCSTDQRTCPFHYNSLKLEPKQSERNFIMKPVPQKKIFSLTNMRNKDDVPRKTWLVKKGSERKKREVRDKVEVKVQQNQKELVIEQERKNFEKWLTKKKQQEAEIKRRQQKDENVKQLQVLEREKKQLENELNFKLWLQKKEEITLERKLKQQIKMMNEIETNSRQTEENQKAYEEWLRKSKTKQKPTPMNRGLRSLCSATSVTYVNPKPWNDLM